LNRKLIVVAVILVLLAVGAGVYTEYYIQQQATATTQQQQETVELRIFVAASLTRVVKDNSTLQAFENENNARVLFNVGGSDTLYQQIYSGSPADVFMAADSSWLQKLNQNGLLYNNQYWNFTTNVLVIILPPDNPKNITSLLDLTNPGVRIAIAGWTVPVGKYTNITLTKIDKTWGNKADSHYKGSQWENYRNRFIGNIITYETNVEQVVTKVLTNTVDAGVAYMSDATFFGQSKLKYLQIPSDVNVKAKYGIGVLKQSTHYDAATKYVNFWLSQDGQSLLAKYGFSASLSAPPASLDTTQAPIAIQQFINARSTKPTSQ
jgi:molybdate transport system substrate-binding protein